MRARIIVKLIKPNDVMKSLPISHNFLYLYNQKLN